MTEDDRRTLKRLSRNVPAVAYAIKCVASPHCDVSLDSALVALVDRLCEINRKLSDELITAKLRESARFIIPVALDPHEADPVAE